MRRSRAVSSTRLPDLGPRHALRREREADVPAHVHVRVEREQLEHEGDVALAGALEGDVLAVEPDLARGRQLEPGDHAQGRGLAAARGAEQHEELPSSMVRLLSWTATKSSNALCRLVSRIWAMAAQSGKWLTTMNITVPARMTGKLQV